MSGCLGVWCLVSGRGVSLLVPRFRQKALDLHKKGASDTPGAPRQLTGGLPQETRVGWFDNEYDRSPSAESMYLEELREFQFYLVSKTDVAELKKLNLLGVQFALCEASKYFFYLRYESGGLYKPSSRNFDLTLQEVSDVERERLRGIWSYWEDDDKSEGATDGNDDDGLHPDHRI